MPSGALCSDQEIVRGLHADDPATIERLVAEYWRGLVRYADGILAGEVGAEDVVQETFFRLWAHRRELKPAGSVRALLFTLTRNAAIDERRRSARRAAMAVGVPHLRAPASPLENAAASELASAIAAAVSRLPSRRREIFVLVRVHGLTYHEVAESLGLAVQTVANQMRAALASLREDLAHHGVSTSRPAADRRSTGVLSFRPPVAGSARALEPARDLPLAAMTTA
jgi:RNA polymerase sigma-70 factor (ECF subfamily)